MGTHPVKEETFDVAAKLNVDPKGFHRTVDEYRVTDFGLYMARGADHPKFGYLESWLLPDFNLRVSIFHFREPVEQDFYVDITDIAKHGDTWTTRDLYLDLVSVTGSPVEVLDTDELSEATAAGLITAREAEMAIDTTLDAVEGITRHNDDVMAWLAARGVRLTWADSVQLTPPM